VVVVGALTKAVASAAVESIRSKTPLPPFVVSIPTVHESNRMAWAVRWTALTTLAAVATSVLLLLSAYSPLSKSGEMQGKIHTLETNIHEMHLCDQHGDADTSASNLKIVVQ
jgi:hypothetical protein